MVDIEIPQKFTEKLADLIEWMHSPIHWIWDVMQAYRKQFTLFVKILIFTVVDFFAKRGWNLTMVRSLYIIFSTMICSLLIYYIFKLPKGDPSTDSIIRALKASHMIVRVLLTSYIVINCGFLVFAFTAKLIFDMNLFESSFYGINHFWQKFFIMKSVVFFVVLFYSDRFFDMVNGLALNKCHKLDYAPPFTILSAIGISAVARYVHSWTNIAYMTIAFVFLHDPIISLGFWKDSARLARW